jgi:DNA-binding SARP family transcriptional activator
MTSAPVQRVGAEIARPRLERRLDEIFGKRLATVVAGAGYGKSTLLAAWCSDVDSAWYTVSPRDESVDRLAGGLGDAVHARLPALAASMGDAAASDAERADGLAGLLCERLENVLAHDLVLVLDDMHELEPGTGGARLVESLCRQAPPLLHLVLASRVPPPFPVQRLRGRGEVLELTSDELAFTPDEVVALAAGLIEADAAVRLHEATGGWPAAVRLALAGREATLEKLARPEGPLYGYLAEEIFARAAPDLRELLRRTSILERLSAPLCDSIGLSNADATLSELVRRGLAVERSGWLAVHSLVREFAAGAWPLRDDEAHDVRRAAGQWFEAEGLDEEALRLFAAAGDRAAVRRVLTARGREIIAAGGADTVIGVRELAAHDELLGEAYTARGDIDRALEHLQAAARGSGRIPASVAWRLVAALHLKDDLEEALRVFERAEVDGVDPLDEALLCGWAVAALRRLGNLDESGALAQRALDAAERSGDDRARALAHTAIALAAERESTQRDRHLARALEAAERAGDVFQCARIRNNRGSVLLEVGAYSNAVDELNRAIQLAEVGGFTTLVALATMNRGLCNYCLGRLEEASADYDAALALYRTMGSREAAYAIIGRGDVHRERGDSALARAAYEEGLTFAEQSGDRQALVPALYQLAKVLVDDEPERARLLAERAVSYGWPDLPWALNAAGWVALVGGDRDAAARAAGRAADAARELGDPYGLAESLELAAMVATDPERARSSLEESLTVWRRLPNPTREAVVELAVARLSGTDSHRLAGRAERRLRSLGVRVSPTAPAGLLRFVAERDSVPVAIETLGGFRVVRSGEAVGPAEWRSQKARDLLKILVARRGAATPRELLMEELWPGDEPARVGNRLSVALSTLRSMLDPSKSYDANHFVRGDTRSIALDLSRVVVDVEDFLAEAAEGLQLRADGSPGAAERLEHAFALYRGDFLAADPYEDWAVSLREEARALSIEIAYALAGDAEAAGRNDEAARFCLRILDRDPYDERAHLLLASSLGAAGRHGDARRHYRTYCRRMEEIGVEPAPLEPVSG